MAVKPQIKTNQFAKDLDIKSKDLIDMMLEKGIDIKPQKALEPHEFNVLFDAITSAHQIESIDDYIGGDTFVPQKKTKNTSKSEAPESKKPVDLEDAANISAEKTEANIPEADKEPTVVKGKDEGDTTARTSVKEPVVEVQMKKENKPDADIQKSHTQEPTAKKEEKAPVVKNNTVDRAAAIARAVAIEKAAREKAQLRADSKKNDERKNNFQRNDQKPRQNQNVQTKDSRFNTNYTNSSQNNPGTHGEASTRPEFNRADAASRSDRFDRFSRTPEKQDRKKDDRRDKKNQRNQMGGMKGFDFDKEDYVASAPKEKFQPQPIIRSQTPKGGDGTNRKGAARVVDTRNFTVDLSKYDEKLDSFVPEDKHTDLVGGNQKLKKQQNQNKQENVIKQKNNKKPTGKQQKQPVKKQVLNVQIPDEIIVSELAALLKVTVAEIIKRLMTLGLMVTANQTVDYDTAAIVADELGAVATKAVVVTIEEKLFDDSEDSNEDLVTRAPVVCVMGHVDHGKTSLLDAIRHTNVTVGEAGGITQHIGAYRVKINGQDITFLDTPGHEAFTAMRARGAQATDIAILVVAADDGIMPQTVEAINHAKAAGIDIIVAINKMDKPGANPENVKQELTKYNLVPEEWGGDVMCVPVSALTGQGIEELLEDVLLVAEVKELKANPNRRAKGIVIEAKLDKGRGPVATVLVQNGTLHNGDIVIAGTAVGRIRAMTDHKGKAVKAATPSVPVEIIGLAEVPLAGDEFAAVEDERMARTLADRRKAEAKEEVFRANARANLNDLFAQISEGVKELNIIIKADVGGSAEAVKNSLEKLSNEEVKVKVIHSAAGGITEGDVMFAAASNAIIVGFNVRPDKAALDSAERQNVEIRTYRVIYQCIEEIEAAMKGMLAPKYTENLLGHSEVRQTIHVPGVGTIAGSYVLDGKVIRSAQIRVVRDGVVIFEDKIASLRRFKDDVKEVAQGYECGIGLEKFNDIRVGDVLEAFVMEEVER